MGKHAVIFGEKEIVYKVERKKVKNINLSVKPDMSVVVSASAEVPAEYIQGFVKEKAPWILKKIGRFLDVQPEPRSSREYVSGESFKYLGKQYRLKVHKSDQEEVKYIRGYINMYVSDTQDYKKKNELFERWLRERAQKIFRESLEKMYPMAQVHGIEKPEIRIKKMKARWGSCIETSNAILLNSELIKAPKYCIDYVVLHELIHFNHKNHDREFYTFLSSLMPDWKKRKAILDEEVVREV